MAIAAHYNQRPSGRGRKQGFLAGIFPVKGDSVGEVLRKIVFLIASCSFIYFGGSVVLDLTGDFVQQEIKKKHMEDTWNRLDLPEEMVERVRSKKPEILPEYVAAYDQNNDLVGHIRYEDKSNPGNYMLNYYVYQSDDNDYYLERTFEHNYSIGGSIFADYRNKFLPDENSANTVLYGHNMMNGEYFTKITNFHATKHVFNGEQAALDYYKRFPVIEFDTIYEKASWKVFAAVLFNTEARHGEVYEYNNKLEFYTVNEFNLFILDIMDRSVLFTDVDLIYGDSILTLSTCYYPMGRDIETRLVVFARKVRDGESDTVNVNKAIYNDRELRFRKQEERYGSRWQGRVWDASYLKSY